MSRTTISETGNREVTLSYTNLDGDRIDRVFWIPMTSSGNAYIRERVRPNRANDPQVCDALYGTGNTLSATPETLIEVIRREWRARRRAETQP